MALTLASWIALKTPDVTFSLNRDIAWMIFSPPTAMPMRQPVML